MGATGTARLVRSPLVQGTTTQPKQTSAKTAITSTLLERASLWREGDYIGPYIYTHTHIMAPCLSPCPQPHPSWVPSSDLVSPHLVPYLLISDFTKPFRTRWNIYRT